MNPRNTVTINLSKENFLILFEMINDHVTHLKNFISLHGETNGLKKQLEYEEQIQRIMQISQEKNDEEMKILYKELIEKQNKNFEENEN
jgi:hypothetical protein